MFLLVLLICSSDKMYCKFLIYSCLVTVSSLFWFGKNNFTYFIKDKIFWKIPYSLLY
jgi:hypothetical protein